MNHQNSQKIFSKAKTLIPGGVNSPARAFGAVGGDPVVMARGEGAFLYDVDGNRYTDYVLSWGPMILGHSHPRVVAALEKALKDGTSFGTPTAAENRLAELLIEAVPSVEMVRLVNSGTEAVMSAIRLARGFTGRDLIVKFSGNYHGHVDSLLVAAGSAAATFSVPNSPGVTHGTASDTIILPYNDSEAVRELFDRCKNPIAAVIVEPVAGNMGCVTGTEDFLTTLRMETEKQGTVLIFDEVMCGFRVDYGGAQKRFGILPDLTTLGKVIGGGLPVGAYGGRAEIMRHILPEGKVFQAGTLSGNPLATAAGIATLEELRDTNPYPTLEQRMKRLGDGLVQAAEKAEVSVQISQCGTMMTLFFSRQPVCGWDTASQCDTAMFSRYFRGLLDRNVYMPCSQFEAFFLSTAHTDALIEETIAAAEDFFCKM
ncbi:MAG: glutamate-1-semialdehyde 2,1-aminomutase [Planctomycetaceae bacterium]|jgi:glutamate-1-semialdehyde 2,1-aminomutase|nr:glutamate-1-semialdehyde 2,1-aminomutase [Planctomycetaceae bacterium]